MPELRNRKHERFARLVANGAIGEDAYGEAYPNAAPQSRKVGACRLLRREDIRERCLELLEAEDARSPGAFLTPERKRRLLLDIAEDGEASAANRMKAIEIDNKMAGESEASALAAEQSKLDALLAELWGGADE